MDSKSFDLFIEAVRGKLKGVIMEKGRGLSVWIKFGDLSLRGMLEGMEACCRDEGLGGGVKVGRRGEGGSS